LVVADLAHGVVERARLRAHAAVADLFHRQEALLALDFGALERNRLVDAAKEAVAVDELCDAQRRIGAGRRRVFVAEAMQLGELRLARADAFDAFGEPLRRGFGARLGDFGDARHFFESGHGWAPMAVRSWPSSAADAAYSFG